MWGSKGNAGKKGEDHGLVAVAIDKDKGSQYAIRWAIDHLVGRGRPIVLIHVTSGSSFAGLPLNFKVKSSRDTSCNTSFQKGGMLAKHPDFCTVYVISKTKVSNVRNASRPVPHTSPLQNYLESIVKDKPNPNPPAPVSTPPRRSLSIRGACPEYGCIVYEYMANGSLDDRLFCRGKTPPLSWQVRFRIAADIATGLNFLHQTKPEPLVHRDLKPGNILLDRYFVAKIGDVGLARLVPPSVADHITQYCMTSAAGTFCYIDPEYQQTGMLGVKSDVYSLGIVLLQILTSRPPMGLAHQVEHYIEKGAFPTILDKSVLDWPVEEALSLAKIAIQCTELRRKDRPDLGNVVLPELDRLRDFADERSQPFMFFATTNPSPANSPLLGLNS